MTLLTRKHPNKDFFVADIFDGTPLKDDTASMEHPFFTLSQKPDMRLLEYRNGLTTVEVIPSILGLPTIMDKDILIYCASLLMQEQNAGREPPRRIRFSANDYFKATNRADNKISYQLLENGLKRLSGCRVNTSIKTNRMKAVSNFGLIERYDYITSHYVKDRLVRYEILLSEWYYNAVLGKNMLTINEDYFLLKKGFERRLYEIARKHCGKQDCFKIRLENLHEKTGSTGALKKFRFNLKKSIQDGDIPDYKFSLDGNDLVTITNANKRVLSPSEKHLGSSEAIDLVHKLRKDTVVKVKKLLNDSYTNLNMHQIIEQFVQHNRDKKLKSLDGTFIGFVKQKIKTNRKDYA